MALSLRQTSASTLVEADMQRLATNYLQSQVPSRFSVNIDKTTLHLPIPRYALTSLAQAF
jgi:hypothetical protein